MELTNRLELFFKTYDKEISIGEIIKKFKLNREESELVSNALYELELDGKIIGNSQGIYKHKPDEYYLYHGVIRKSNKNKYYIVCDNGIVNIHYNNLMGAVEGDTVYVQVKKGKKHIKQVDGKVYRIVKKNDVVNSKTFYKTILKRDNIKNYYYVIIDEQKIYIYSDDVKDAFVGDTVSVMVTNNKYGKVIEVLKRCDHQEILKYVKDGSHYGWVLLNDPKRQVNVTIDNDWEFRENDQILVKYENDSFNFLNKIEDSNKLKSQIDAMICSANIPIDFSKEAMDEANIINEIDISKEIDKRTDLRNLLTFTIDGDNAKDLDDAVSLEVTSDGYILYVHIADVSYFVRPGSKLYDEAYLRGTSIYPANYVYPMLPKIISNGVCSLNQGEDKLTKTVKMKFDKDGNLQDYNIFNSVINSNYRMNYSSVNSILDDNVMVNGYESYESILKDMQELAKLLEKKKINRGAISFDTLELNFVLGTDDMIEEITDRDRGPAEKLIENFMLMANQVVATFAYYLQTSFIYRNHDVPTIEQLTRLKYSLLKYRRYFRSYNNFDNPVVLQKILYSIHKDTGDIESMYYSGRILSCMNRAYYSGDNNGHYALALPQYGTFTSPIRRFPDLFNHYVIGEILGGNINMLDGKFNLSEMSQHVTLMQIEAENIERQADNLLLSNYILDYKGRELVGEVIFINKDFICVKTKELFYGNIPLRKKDRQIINNMNYKPGDQVIVKIDNINEYTNEINFMLVNKNVKCLKKEIKKEGIRV